MRTICFAVLSIAASLVIGCSADQLPRAATTQPSANPWRPYTSGEFRQYESSISAAEHSVRDVGNASTKPSDWPTLQAGRVLSTTERVLQGDQFSVTYFVWIAVPHGGDNIAVAEPQARDLLAQIDEISNRTSGVNSASSKAENGNFLYVARGSTAASDDVVKFRMSYSDIAGNPHNKDVAIDAKPFRAALVLALQDIEKLKRLPIIAP